MEDSRILFYSSRLPLLNFELYILSVYFVLTTIATVGYGDVGPTTTIERIYVIFLMIIGVLFFTMLSGALASILTAYDNHTAELKEKLLYLNQIKVKNKISENLYQNIRSALNHDTSKDREMFNNFIDSLPLHLKLDLAMEVHNISFQEYTLFSDIGSKSFLIWIGHHLQSEFLQKGQMLYLEGDEIDNFYFMTSG